MFNKLTMGIVIMTVLLVASSEARADGHDLVLVGALGPGGVNNAAGCRRRRAWASVSWRTWPWWAA